MGERTDHRRRSAAVLISGRGSNLRALIDATSRENASARIAAVISNRPDALGLEIASRAGIATRVVDHTAFEDLASFEDRLEAVLRELAIELVCLAGFMRILSPDLVARWRDRMLNVHPSLLPAFPGLDTHRRALEAGVRFSGCTVHLVRAEVDAGPIVVQGVVPVHPHDTPESLAARVLPVEHRCYPLALELVASGRVRVEGERVLVRGASRVRPTVLINPSLDDE